MLTSAAGIFWHRLSSATVLFLQTLMKCKAKKKTLTLLVHNCWMCQWQSSTKACDRYNGWSPFKRSSLCYIKESCIKSLWTTLLYVLHILNVRVTKHYRTLFWHLFTLHKVENFDSGGPLLFTALPLAVAQIRQTSFCQFLSSILVCSIFEHHVLQKKILQSLQYRRETKNRVFYMDQIWRSEDHWDWKQYWKTAFHYNKYIIKFNVTAMEGISIRLTHVSPLEMFRIKD